MCIIWRPVLYSERTNPEVFSGHPWASSTSCSPVRKEKKGTSNCKISVTSSCYKMIPGPISIQGLVVGAVRKWVTCHSPGRCQGFAYPIGWKETWPKMKKRKRKAPRDPSIISHLFPSGKWMLFKELPRGSGQLMTLGSCYSFSKQKKDWHASRQSCGAQGAHLLVISGTSEMVFIMRSALSRSSFVFWIGLTRNRAEGPRLWEDGSAFSPGL
uniref:C-type lectin domain-containing protein n=1 Tax=Amazona collaria TaxID=241587 RepID=A0A8B9EWA9_9PSIT